MFKHARIGLVSIKTNLHNGAPGVWDEKEAWRSSPCVEKRGRPGWYLHTTSSLPLCLLYTGGVTMPLQVVADITRHEPLARMRSWKTQVPQLSEWSTIYDDFHFTLHHSSPHTQSYYSSSFPLTLIFPFPLRSNKPPNQFITVMRSKVATPNVPKVRVRCELMSRPHIPNPV